MTLSQKYLKTLLKRIDSLLEQQPLRAGFVGEEIEILTTVIALLEKITTLTENSCFTGADFSLLFSSDQLSNTHQDVSH